MEKITASRHFEINNRVKSFINDELGQIEKEYNKLTSARVVLDQQKSWYSAEVILHGKNIEHTAQAREKDVFAAISSAIEKIDRQLRKHLDKVQDHKKKSVSEIEIASSELET